MSVVSGIVNNVGATAIRLSSDDFFRCGVVDLMKDFFINIQRTFKRFFYSI